MLAPVSLSESAFSTDTAPSLRSVPSGMRSTTWNSDSSRVCLPEFCPISRLWDLRSPQPVVQKQMGHCHRSRGIEFHFKIRRFCRYVWLLCVRKFTRFIEQGFLPRKVLLIKRVFEQGVLLRRDMPTHLLGDSGLSETFWCNFRHAAAIRHELIFLLANHNSRTTTPMGNECRSRVSLAFSGVSAYHKPARRSQSRVC